MQSLLVFFLAGFALLLFGWLADRKDETSHAHDILTRSTNCLSDGGAAGLGDTNVHIFDILFKRNLWLSIDARQIEQKRQTIVTTGRKCLWNTPESLQIGRWDSDIVREMYKTQS